MRTYEALVIFSPAVTGLDSKNTFEELVKKFEGKIVNRTEMGKRLIGYTVKKSKEGYFVAFDFELPQDKMDALKRALDLSEDVLKYTLIKKGKAKLALLAK